MLETFFEKMPEWWSPIEPKSQPSPQLKLFEPIYDLIYIVIGSQSLFDGRSRCWEHVGYRYFEHAQTCTPA